MLGTKSEPCAVLSVIEISTLLTCHVYIWHNTGIGVGLASECAVSGRHFGGIGSPLRVQFEHTVGWQGFRRDNGLTGGLTPQNCGPAQSKDALREFPWRIVQWSLATLSNVRP